MAGSPALLIASVSQVLLDQVLVSLAIVAAAAILSRLVRHVVKHTLRRLGSRRVQERLKRIRRHAPAALLQTTEMETIRSSQRSEALAAAVSGAAAFAVWVAALVVILHVLGARLGPVLAGAGLLGVALGFGAQSLIRDVLSGFFILTEDQFGVGDWITVTETGGAEESGEVEAVSLRATRIRAVDGTVWHIPNGRMGAVGNMSQHWSRALVDIRVAYATDVERARAVMKQAADEVWEANPEILEEPEVWGVVSMGPAGIVIRLVAKTQPLQQWRMSRKLRERIKARLDEEGIEAPPLPLAVPEPVSARRPS